MIFVNPVWQLKILLSDGTTKIYSKLKKDETSLKISFRCESAINSVPPSGDITIVGLEASDIEYLATRFLPQSGKLLPSQIELSAGWDSALNLVLFGNVMQTTPDFTTADHSIQLQIMNGLQINQANAFSGVSYNGKVTLRDILANLASQNKLILDANPKLTNYILYDYSYQGSLYEQLIQLRSFFSDIELTLKNKTLIATTKDTKGTPSYLLSPTSGLLGTPKPTPQGCELRSYMLPNLYAGDFIELKTNKLQRLNGVYKVLKITHQGASRDPAWYSDIICINMIG